MILRIKSSLFLNNFLKRNAIFKSSEIFLRAKAMPLFREGGHYTVGVKWEVIKQIIIFLLKWYHLHSSVYVFVIRHRIFL